MFPLYMKCDQNVQEALFGRKDVEMLLESVQNQQEAEKTETGTLNKSLKCEETRLAQLN